MQIPIFNNILRVRLTCNYEIKINTIVTVEGVQIFYIPLTSSIVNIIVRNVMKETNILLLKRT